MNPRKSAATPDNLPYLLVLLVLFACTVATPTRSRAARQASNSPSSRVAPGPITAAARHIRAVATSPVWARWVDGCELVKWSNLHALSCEDGRVETLVLRDRRSRTVLRLSADVVGFAFARPALRHRSGLLCVYTLFGCDCRFVRMSATCYVYSLGRSPRCLLVYQKGLYSYEHPNFTPVGRGARPDILTWYDGFYGQYGELYWRGPMVPILLGYRHGRYVDVTSSEWVRAGEPFRQALIAADEGFEDRPWLAGKYALRLLLGPAAGSTTHWLHSLPSGDRDWLLQHKNEISHTLAARDSRLRYQP